MSAQKRFPIQSRTLPDNFGRYIFTVTSVHKMHQLYRQSHAVLLFSRIRQNVVTLFHGSASALNAGLPPHIKVDKAAAEQTTCSLRLSRFRLHSDHHGHICPQLGPYERIS